MKAGFWIAGRYSFARKRFRVINIISGISLGGIIVGVSTLLIVMSVLNGFQKLSRELFLTIESPVQLVPYRGRSVAVPDGLLRSLERVEGVGWAQPFAEGQAVMTKGGRSELVIVKGLTEEGQKRLMRQKNRGVPYFGKESISAGEALAWRLGLMPGDRVRLFSPELISVGLQSLSQPYLLPALSLTDASIGSLFSLQKIFDDRYLLASDSTARGILMLGEGLYSGIDIRGGTDISDSDLERNLERWLQGNRLDHRFRVRTLDEKYRDLFVVMQLEKWASFSVLMLVIMVAVLSLAGSLAMTVIDKRRELFYLRCLGLERREFMTIFIVEGGLTGLAGTMIGSAVAWGICRAQEAWGLVQLPSKSAFIIDAYPVSMHAGDFLVVGISTIILCLLVSLFPAGKAAAIATSHTLDSKSE
ncbi:MAG: ABC transporter permease [Chlorobiaceae bacterium]|nr:ABC transporter permease [Chlorobiaceae bacterium]